MLDLKMNYKDDDFQGKRKYNQTINDDGTSSYDDATTYTTVGDNYGGADINKSNAAIMGFVSCNTNFSADGKTAVETDSYGNTLTTVFSADGKTITQTLCAEDGTVEATKTTVFSANGRTITEEASIS